eukprot:scaffold297_cov171-Amphora_coffeaeformis.AAC.23
METSAGYGILLLEADCSRCWPSRATMEPFTRQFPTTLTLMQFLGGWRKTRPGTKRNTLICPMHNNLLIDLQTCAIMIIAVRIVSSRNVCDHDVEKRSVFY